MAPFFRYTDKMGQHMSIAKELQVSLSDYKIYTNDTYTVTRTSGLLDAGWGIGTESSLEPTVDGPCATKQCAKDTGVWRIFMDNGKKSPDEYVCGWRRLETIWPTRLSGDEQAIKVWREAFVQILDTLEAKRLEAYEQTPAENE